MTQELLRVENLVKHYPIKGGLLKKVKAHVQAVSAVSFSLARGETLGLVGESGCGKSTLGRNIMQLERPTSGEVFFEGQNVTELSDSKLRPLRKNFQMIFQDPFSSLNPKMTVLKLLSEPMLNFGLLPSKKDLENKVQLLMKDVGLRPEYIGRYPHEFSGGQRQRISIGRALASNPRLVVCDEPVSALDVSIQAQILNLMLDLQQKYGFSYIFISHDLHVVRHISKRIAVMYLGRIVEIAPSEEIYKNPIHPYTKALLSAVPTAKAGQKRNRIVLQGDVPSPISPPSGCAFHPRCLFAKEECKKAIPKLSEISSGRQVACIRAGEL